MAKEEARRRANLAIDTFLPGGRCRAGGGRQIRILLPFPEDGDAKRAGKSEISTVDTAILVAGAITAGEYLGGDVKAKAEQLYERVEWDKFLEEDKGPWFNNFSMGWSPERGFLESYWDYYTDEVILISLMA